MSNSSSVLVAVDFSAASRRAYEAATQICLRAGLELNLLHVWNISNFTGEFQEFMGAESWFTEQMNGRIKKLDEWAKHASAAGVEVSTRVVDGVASRKIPDVARDTGACLLILGRHGSANLAHVLVGSVCERVVNLSPCPVLVIPERGSSRACPDRMMVGVDFSLASKQAYLAAREFALQLGAKRGLVLAHVRPSERELWLEGWSELLNRENDPLRDRGHLKRWAELPENDVLQVEFEILEGSSERLLVGAAEDEGCDWLVLGLQGRTALAQIFMGRTTDRILKLADRPVLVVPTP